MAQFHFVEDYEKHVANLVAAYPIDEAMALSVGGNFEGVGQAELNILQHVGLQSGMSVLDLGCGSGRLAVALGNSGLKLDYLGTDVVQDLLNYAKSKTPDYYRFALHRELSIPSQDSSIDLACAFSVFTHLLHHETYIYLEEIRRVLKPEGHLVFSFLEFAADNHWNIFKDTVEDQRHQRTPHLNTFIERNAIELWSSRLGFKIEKYIGDHERVGGGEPLGQSTVILALDRSTLGERITPVLEPGKIQGDALAFALRDAISHAESLGKLLETNLTEANNLRTALDKEKTETANLRNALRTEQTRAKQVQSLSVGWAMRREWGRLRETGNQLTGGGIRALTKRMLSPAKREHT
jgi:ubiquinone/menaquinone biosynthesis C-methylase UbiE